LIRARRQELERDRAHGNAAVHSVAMGGGLELALGCHYRVALAVNDPSELPAAPLVTRVGFDPCGSAEIQDPPIFPVLADNLLPHAQPFATPQTFTITLPAAIPAEEARPLAAVAG